MSDVIFPLTEQEIQELVQEERISENMAYQQLLATEYHELALLADYPPISLSIHYWDYVNKLMQVIQKTSDPTKTISKSPFESFRKQFEKQISEAQKYMSKYGDNSAAHAAYIKANKDVDVSMFENRYRPE